MTPISTKVHITSVDKLPQGEHWAILEDSSIHIPGDERSRTNPGHGYPASTEHIIAYYAYTDREEFELDLKYLIEQSRSQFGRSVRGVHISGSFTAKTVIHLEEK